MSNDITKELSSNILAQILERLVSLEEKVDSRLVDTRPIWERALAEILELSQGQAELRKEIAEMRQEFKHLNSRFDKLDRKFGVLGEDFIAIRAEVRDVSLRLDKLEDELIHNS